MQQGDGTALLEAGEIMDKELLKLIARWERLSWFDRKRICWISFWSCCKISSQDVITTVAVLALISITTFEPHHHDKVGLLMAVGLLYFYTTLIDYMYKRAH